MQGPVLSVWLTVDCVHEQHTSIVEVNSLLWIIRISCSDDSRQLSGVFTLGSSRVHQRLIKGLDDWDSTLINMSEREREEYICVQELPEELRSAAEHTAPVSRLGSLTSCQLMKPARSFISTQTPGRLMCRTKTTFIPLLLSPLVLCCSGSVHAGICYMRVEWLYRKTSCRLSKFYYSLRF